MSPLDWIKLGLATLDAALTEHRAERAADALEVAKANEQRARERLAKLRSTKTNGVGVGLDGRGSDRLANRRNE